MGFVDKLKSFMIETDVSDESLRANILDASSSAKRDPLKALAKKIGLSLGGGSRDFADPEFDLTVIETAYQSEAYVRQGIDKYIDKMFKAGWTFTGSNPTTVDYIKQRFAYMAEVTQIPTDKLFIEYCEDIVKFSNAILVKARMSDQAQLPPGLTIQGMNGAQPVVGYFPINATTMQVKRDSNGTVKQWKQVVSGADKEPKFKPDDVVHTYYKRVKGNAFGTPFLLAVLNDIRALRQAEDNVLKMLYRNIYPFYHIAIGSSEFPSDDPEIQAGKEEVEGMEVDGGLVTSERWTIKAISADKVIDANPYLAYFEARVFSGLGVPATMFGRGATANKSTSDNMDSEFLDRVNAFQRVSEADVNEFMIKELLMEGGFDPVLNLDDMVFFKFNEINIDAKIKNDNDAIYKYEHSAITEDEMRQLLGLDIIVDRSKMYNQVVTQEKSDIAQAATIATSQATASTATTNTSKNNTSTTGTASSNNKQQPKNQHNTPSKTKNNLEEVCKLYTEHLDELNDSVMTAIDEFYEGDKYALSQINTDIYFKSKVFEDININNLNSEIVDSINAQHNRMFNEFREDLVKTMTSIKTTNAITRDSAKSIISNLFNIMEHKANFIVTQSITHKEV